MDILIKRLGTEDLKLFKSLIFLFEDVFERIDFKIPPDIHLERLLLMDGFYALVAMFENKVAGGLTAYTLDQYYSQSAQVYIYDLAVSTKFQRQGIGKKLMECIISMCRETGIEEVFVQAEAIDDHAIEFYHATGGIAEKVVHFNYPLICK